MFARSSDCRSTIAKSVSPEVSINRSLTALMDKGPVLEESNQPQGRENDLTVV